MESLGILENVNLAHFSTLKIGGMARFFAYGNSSNIKKLSKFAKENSIEMFVMGKGSNLLISSAKIDALVVKMNRNSSYQLDEYKGLLKIDAGDSLSGLVRAYIDNGFSGIELLAGIPGSVGGAIFMNAGVKNPHTLQISDFFVEGEFFLKNGEIKKLEQKDLNFAYRYSALQENGAICLNASFRLDKRESKKILMAKIRQILTERLSRQPENKRNCGSVFKALTDGRPAGLLIDKCGLKGLRVGDAMVSFKHANWIENLSNASSSDVLELIAKIKTEVKDKFGEDLQEEVQYFGF